MYSLSPSLSHSPFFSLLCSEAMSCLRTQFGRQVAIRLRAGCFSSKSASTQGPRAWSFVLLLLQPTDEAKDTWTLLLA